MKRIEIAVAVIGLAGVCHLQAITTNDIQLWTGCGTNHAGMVIEWNAPLVGNYSSVPTPIATKTMVWGYAFNGNPTATQMFNAIVASDPRLYAVVNNTYGTFVEGIGYNLDANGIAGVADGACTYGGGAFTNGILLNTFLNPDSAYPLDTNDLFWCGYFGPNWNIWTELNDNGGFTGSPERSSSAYARWDPDAYVWTQGQWESASYGLDLLTVQDGSWIGFSVGAAGYDTNAGDPATIAFTNNEQAPPEPDGGYYAVVLNTNNFAVQIVATSNIDPSSPYNNPEAVLGAPTLWYVDGSTLTRTMIVDPPYNVDTSDNDVITEISNGGEITVNMGQKVYHNPANPYGYDFIVFGNSFLDAKSSVGESSDLNNVGLSSGYYGHPTVVSVSQDGINWYTNASVSYLYPDNSYRWDNTNQCWLNELLNPNKPLNPYVYTAGNQSTCANELSLFVGSFGGQAYSLAASGFPWIQYIKITPTSGTYTVIDAIGTVNPVAVGDFLSIAPVNITDGITNLSFQSPGNLSSNLISINFKSVSENSKVSTVALHDFSSFAPVPGCVSSAYQISVLPIGSTTPATYTANLALTASSNYTGDGSDLRVLQWGGQHWNLIPFSYNATSNQVNMTGLTNFSALVVSQLGVRVCIHPATNGYAFGFTPFGNVTYNLQRTCDFTCWTNLATITPTNEWPVCLFDTNPPPQQAFYRVQLVP